MTTDPETVISVEVVKLRPDIWQVVAVGSRGTKRPGNRYNTEADARRNGAYLVGLVMR